MDCKFAKNNLIDFYYRELNDESLRLIENHLIDCTHCQILFNKISAVMCSADCINEMQAPDFIETRILAKTESHQIKQAPMKVLQYFLRPALVASIAVLGIWVGIMIGNNLPDNSTQAGIVNEDNSHLAKLFASENYLNSPGDELIEMYINNNKE